MRMEVAIYIAVVVCIAVVFVGRPTDRSVALFSDNYSVPLTSTNVELLRSYIWWSRAWRIGPTVLVVIVLDLVGLVDDGGNAPLDISVQLVITTYAIGTLIGEFLRPRPDTSTTATASMNRRSVTDFVSYWFVGMCAAALTAVVVGAAWHLTHAGSDAGWFAYAPTDGIGWGQRFAPWYVSVVGGGAVFIAVATWLTAIRLAQAPMMRVQSDRRAVDHAIRTAALLTIGGAALLAVAGIGYHLTNTATAASQGDGTVWQWLLGITKVVSALAALAGGYLTWTAIPRFSAIWRRLPDVPAAETSMTATS